MAHQHPGVIAVPVDAPKEAAASGVLARLAEREEQRAASAARRLEELQLSGDPRESVDAFMADFGAQRAQLEAALEEAAGSGGGGGGGGTGDASALAALAERIAELEKAVADATYFLPAYDLRHATLALAALRERQEAAAAAQQPRRRFAFSRKGSAKAVGEGAAAEPAAAAAAAGEGGQPAVAAAEAQQQRQQPQQAQQQAPQQQQQGNGAAGASTGSGNSASGRTISGLRGGVVAPSRAEAAGQEFTLSDLEDCTVFLPAPLAALFLHGLRRCRVVTGPVAGACFVEGAEACTLMIAARQVRIHSARSSNLYLRVRSHPIIEHSSALRFAPYSPTYEGAEADLEAQGLAPDSGMWARVNDFGWLRATPSPHWGVLPEGERAAAPGAAPAAAGGGDGDAGGA